MSAKGDEISIHFEKNHPVKTTELSKEKLTLPKCCINVYVSYNGASATSLVTRIKNLQNVYVSNKLFNLKNDRK